MARGIFWEIVTHVQFAHQGKQLKGSDPAQRTTSEFQTHARTNERMHAYTHRLTNRHTDSFMHTNCHRSRAIPPLTNPAASGKPAHTHRARSAQGGTSCSHPRALVMPCVVCRQRRKGDETTALMGAPVDARNAPARPACSWPLAVRGISALLATTALWSRSPCRTNSTRVGMLAR